MRERLKEIPPKLTDLFEMIVTRDGEKLERLQLCLKWILFATRPIKPQELYFAIQLGLDKSCSGYWDQEDVDLDQMKTYVRSSSKGLAEVTRNKASEVQFIHESVRGFLFGKYESQWSGVSGNFVGHCHETLRDCCLAQLNASISQGVDIPDPLPEASKAVQLRETINLKFPFLEYSILNVLHHANSAQHNAIEQANFLAKFPLQQWKFLNNALERYQIRRYNDPVSMLYILAEKNLADLIRIHPQRESCFDVENGRYGPPIFAALVTSSSEAVRVLFNIQAQIQPSMSPLHDLCKQYCQDKEKWATLGLGFTYSRKRGVLSYVAEYGDEILLSFLIESGQSALDTVDIDNRTPLLWAAKRGHEGIAKLLLEKGANVDATNGAGQTPLHQASEDGHLNIVKLLLEKGANMDAVGGGRWTPLRWACLNRHVDVVKLLLEKGADMTATGRDRCHYQASRTACRHCQAATREGGQYRRGYEDGGHHCARPLRTGMSTSLSCYSRRGPIWTWLLEDWRTPLRWASQNGHVDIVKLLLERGADVTANKMKTPLFWASQNGHVDVVKLYSRRGPIWIRYGMGGCHYAGPLTTGMSTSSSFYSRRGPIWIRLLEMGGRHYAGPLTTGTSMSLSYCSRRGPMWTRLMELNRHLCFGLLRTGMWMPPSYCSRRGPVWMRLMGINGRHYTGPLRTGTLTLSGCYLGAATTIGLTLLHMAFIREKVPR